MYILERYSDLEEFGDRDRIQRCVALFNASSHAGNRKNHSKCTKIAGYRP